MKSIWHEPGYQHPYPLHNKTIVSIDGRVIYWSMYGWSVPYKGDVTGIGVRWALLDDLLKLLQTYENILSSTIMNLDSILTDIPQTYDPKEIKNEDDCKSSEV